MGTNLFGYLHNMKSPIQEISSRNTFLQSLFVSGLMVFVFCPKVGARTVDTNERPCIDSEGKQHDHGDEWNQGACMHCQCYNGFPACMSPMCMAPILGGVNCRDQPGQENVCCNRRHICEEGMLSL